MFLLVTLLAFLLQTPADNTAQTTALLRAKDQALLDAIGPGDKKVWDATLAPEAEYVDENGEVMNRSQYLEQLQPLPAGVSGNLHIASYMAHIVGDLATVIHIDDEQEYFHGQTLQARYLTSETWYRGGDDWKLYLVHVYAVPKDPPATTLPAKELEQYVGHYTAAPGLVYVIRFDGSQLTGGRQGSTPKPLKVELRDVLFVPGEPRIRKIFQRDAKGKITGFADRRESWDLVWKKTKS